MTAQPDAASSPVEIRRAAYTHHASQAKTQKSAIFDRVSDEKELQLPSVHLLLFLWKVGHEIGKFQHEGESPIVLKHLGKVSLYEIRRDDGMLPVDQADESWVACFLDEDVPQTDVGMSEGRRA